MLVETLKQSVTDFYSCKPSAIAEHKHSFPISRFTCCVLCVYISKIITNILQLYQTGKIKSIPGMYSPSQQNGEHFLFEYCLEKQQEGTLSVQNKMTKLILKFKPTQNSQMQTVTMNSNEAAMKAYLHKIVKLCEHSKHELCQRNMPPEQNSMATIKRPNKIRANRQST